MSSFWKIFISVVVTAGIIGGGIFYIMQKQIDKINSDNLAKSEELTKQIATLKSTTATTTTTTPATTDETVNWKTAQLDQINVKFKYPKEWGSYTVEKQGAEKGSSYLLKFSDYSSTSVQPWVSYVSSGFEAGRSGTVAEGLSYHAITNYTCAKLVDSSSTKSCSPGTSKIGQVFTIKDTVDASADDMHLYDREIDFVFYLSGSFPYFSLQLPGKTDLQIKTANLILASIDKIN